MGRVKKQSKAKRLDATACDNNWSAEAEACLWRILVHGISSRSFFFSLSSFGQKLNYQPFTLLILSIHTLYSFVIILNMWLDCLNCVKFSFQEENINEEIV